MQLYSLKSFTLAAPSGVIEIVLSFFYAEPVLSASPLTLNNPLSVSSIEE